MRYFFDGLYTPDPGVIDGLLALSVLYCLAIGPARKYLAPKEPFEKWRAASFAMGVLVLTIAVASPIDYIGETYLFSVHMFQHSLLIFVIPPFFIFGIPNWLSNFFFRTEGLGKILKFFVHPIPACFFFNSMLILWHFPSLYEFALRDSAVHLLEHLSFTIVSIFMYWPLLGPSPNGKSLHYGLKILYILAVNIGQLPLYGVLTLSETVLYPTYAEAPRYFPTVGPLEDQVLGGVVMMLIGSVFMFGGLMYCFYRWYCSEVDADTVGAHPIRLR